MIAITLQSNCEGGSKMNPDNIIDILKKMEINISRKTLYNYEQWGLISAPTFRNSRNTDYPNCVIEEAFATWRLLRGESRRAPRKVLRLVPSLQNTR